MLLFACIALMVVNAQAQPIKHGAVTDTRFGKQAALDYTMLKLNLGNRFTTMYTPVEADKKMPLRRATVAFDTLTKMISVTLVRMVDKDTVYDKRDFLYRDSLGLLFTPQRAVVEEPELEVYPLFAFESAKKNFLLLLSVDETGKSAERHYRFDEPTLDMIETNAELLSKPVVVVTPKPAAAPPTLPKPTPPAKGTARTQYYFYADSIETIVRPANRDVVEMCILFRGGVSNYDVFKQGIEWVALNTALYGSTKSMSADDVAKAFELAGLRTKLDFYQDRTTLTCAFPLASWDDAWKLLGDVLLRSAFSMDDFETSRSELMSVNTPSQNFISHTAYEAALKDAFAVRQLDESPYGTLNSVTSMTYEDAKKFYQTLLTRSRIALSVTGNVTPEMVRKKIKTDLKQMPLGYYGSYPVQNFEPLSSTYKTIPEPQTQNNIVTLIASSPRPYSTEMIAYEIGLVVLERRLEQTLASRRLVNRFGVYNLPAAQPLSMIQFESNDPDKAMQAMLDELKRTKKLGITEAELSHAKNIWLARFYFNVAESTTLTETAAALAYYNQPDFIDDATDLATRMKSDAVVAALKRYTKGFKIYLAGNPEAANPIIYTQKTEF